ncbi:hypothetical protein FJZ39_01745 [Candidatus Saccharibacteria bacterium]|nr:hypothetical protein [Candidatus Saccharibacteria bacterium]
MPSHNSKNIEAKLNASEKNTQPPLSHEVYDSLNEEFAVHAEHTDPKSGATVHMVRLNLDDTPLDAKDKESLEYYLTYIHEQGESKEAWVNDLSALIENANDDRAFAVVISEPLEDGKVAYQLLQSDNNPLEARLARQQGKNESKKTITLRGGRQPFVTPSKNVRIAFEPKDTQDKDFGSVAFNYKNSARRNAANDENSARRSRQDAAKEQTATRTAPWATEQPKVKPDSSKSAEPKTQVIKPGTDLEVFVPYNQRPEGDAARALRLSQNLDKYGDKLSEAEKAAVVAMATRKKGSLRAKKRNEKALEQEQQVTSYERWALALDNTQRKIWHEQGIDEAEIEQRIIARQNDRADSFNDRVREQMKSNYKGLGKYMDKYANLSTGKKVALGLGVTAIAAAGAGVIVGGLGAAGAAAGAGGAVKMTSAYVRKRTDMYKGNRFVTGRSNSNEDMGGTNDIIGGNYNFRSKKNQELYKTSDRDKRIALGLGVLGGSLLATSALVEWDNLIKWNKDAPSGRPITEDDVRQPEPGLSGNGALRIPDNHEPARSPEAPATGDQSGGSVEISVPQDVYRIDAGQGFNETFSRMGITNSADWARLLKDEELMNYFVAQNKAYEAPELGGYGISAPGHFSQNDIDKMYERAAALGIEVGGSSVETGEIYSADTIYEGQGWNAKFMQLGIHDAASQQKLLENEALMNRFVAADLAYVDESLGGYGMYMTPDGAFPEWAQDMITAQHAADIASGNTGDSYVADIPPEPGTVTRVPAPEVAPEPEASPSPTPELSPTAEPTPEPSPSATETAEPAETESDEENVNETLSFVSLDSAFTAIADEYNIGAVDRAAAQQVIEGETELLTELSRQNLANTDSFGNVYIGLESDGSLPEETMSEIRSYALRNPDFVQALRSTREAAVL